MSSIDMVSPSEILAMPVIVVAVAATAELANSIVAIRGIRAGQITMGAFSAITTWIERRRQLRRLFQDGARELIERDSATAYYDAQRAAARARFSGDGRAFLHWAKVAAEVARISNAPMDYEIVKSIVDEEERRAKLSL